MTLNVPTKSKGVKYLTALLAVALLNVVLVPVTYANNAAYIQQILGKKINVEVTKGTFADIMVAICKEADAQYSIKNDVIINKNNEYSISSKNQSVESTLQEFLKETNYDFRVNDDKILIVNRISPSLIQQSEKIDIKGRVLAADGKPVVGATVIIDGTSDGAITDENGDFIIKARIGNKITISSTAYKEATVTIDKKEIVIIMAADIVDMEEVVVTGVFTRNQNTYSGATTTIKKEELERTGSLNIINALGSIDPAFNILTNNEMGSNPNALPDIQMRGASSFSDMKDNYTTSPNQPLFVVDGFEATLETVLDMDMNRVASVTLLKDATAKAIYGAKGANGVVVIETLAPAVGELRVSYRGDLNIQAPALGDYNLANAQEYLEIRKAAGWYTSTSPEYQAVLNEEYAAIQRDILSGVDTDWLAQPTRVGFGHKHSLTLEGGDEVFRYSVNVGVNNIAGVMKGSDRNTFDGGVNLQYRYKNLIFKEQFTYRENRAIESPYGSFEDYTKIAPYWKPYDENGNVTKMLGEYDSFQGGNSYDIYNPMYNAASGYKNTSNYNELTNNFYIEYTPIEDFKLIGRLGITKREGQMDVFYPATYSTLTPNSEYNFASVEPDDAEDAYLMRGLYRLQINSLNKLSSDITLNYSKQLDKHLIFANAQYSISTEKTSFQNFEGRGFYEGATEITQARSYQEEASPYGSDETVREIGIIASVNYSFDNRFLFDANYRANASSLYGANSRWGHFWSVGAGWNVHNEKFMKNIEWIDRFKLRGSFGYTGSQNFKSYQAIATYSFYDETLYDNYFGAYLLSMYNPDLSWQLTEDQNIGFDATLLNNKFNVSFDYYVKNTTDLLTPITAAPSIGFETFMDNLGSSKNSGFEAKISYNVISNNANDVFLSVFGNIAANKNVLTEINDALQSINDATKEDFDPEGNDLTTDHALVSRPKVLYAEGVSIDAIWAVPSLGIDPSNGKEIFVRPDGTTTYEYDIDYMQPLGDKLPKARGTFGFNLDYKGFTLNTIFAYNFGGQIYNSTLVEKVETADTRYNVDRRVLEGRWQTPGVAAPFGTIDQYYNYVKPTSRFIQDHNELSLSTLNIGYDFRNSAFIKSNKYLERLRVQLSMTDLIRFSTVDIERGILYPYAKSFIFTVQATF